MKLQTCLTLVSRPIKSPVVSGVTLSPSAVRLIEDYESLDQSHAQLMWTSDQVALIWGVPHKPFRRWLGRIDRPTDAYRGFNIGGRLWIVKVPICTEAFQAVLAARFAPLTVYYPPEETGIRFRWGRKNLN